jgi:hypothetical protein
MVPTWYQWKVRTSESVGIMGHIGIKVNGEWIDLMSAFVPCQLCNEPVQIRDLENLSSEAVNGVVTWQCAKCKAVNG